jgi:hypothetical protein
MKKPQAFENKIGFVESADELVRYCKLLGDQFRDVESYDDFVWTMAFETRIKGIETLLDLVKRYGTEVVKK